MIKTLRASTGTTRVLLTANEDQDMNKSSNWVTVKNPAGVGATVFLGGPDVTTGTGFELPAGATLTLQLTHGDRLYGITANGSVNLFVMQGGI